MVWMPENPDIAGRIIVFQPVFSVGARQCQSLCDLKSEEFKSVSCLRHNVRSKIYLFIYNDVDLDTPRSSSEKHPIKPILLVLRRRPSQVQLRAEPPVQDPDGVSGILESHTDSPHVRAAVDVPLGIVALTLGRKGLEAVHVVLIAIRALGRGMSVCVYVSLVGLLRLSFGVATTYGLLDSPLDIAKCLLRLIKQETHLYGFFLMLGGRLVSDFWP